MTVTVTAHNPEDAETAKVAEDFMNWLEERLMVEMLLYGLSPEQAANRVLHRKIDEAGVFGSDTSEEGP